MLHPLRSSLLGLAVAGAGAVALGRRRRRMELEGRCAIVTGGSRGLGLLVARELARRGARLVLCARDEAELERARAELLEEGAEVLAVHCDLSDPGAAAALVRAAELRFGAVDALFNVAGIIQVGPYATLGLDDLRAAMDVNFWGTVHATWAALPGMRERGQGRIVNVTSVGGVVAVPHLLGYTCSKWAAVGFSTGLAAEAARDGVRVVTVVPGLMRTGSFLHALVKGRREAEASLFAVASSLPVLTMDAGRAARRIVLACERGEGFVTLGAPAKLLRLAAALAPNLTGGAMALLARALPGPGGDAPEGRATPAARHRRGAGRSVLTGLGDAAAARNNEGPPIEAT